MKAEIILEGMEFYANHGCYELERKVGMRFVVDLWIAAEVGDSAEVDSLEGTVNYLTVFETVRREMDVPSRTIENVAWRILESLFVGFGNVDGAKVKVTKIAPSLGGKVEKASVVLSRNL